MWPVQQAVTAWTAGAYDGRKDNPLSAMVPTRRTILFVAVALLAIAGWVLGGRGLRTRFGIASLVESSPERLPTARFSALPVITATRSQSVMRGGGKNIAADARAAAVIDTASSAQAAAAGYATLRDWRSAIARLQQATIGKRDDASLWSDLAAARYERGAEFGNVEEMFAALADADRSLRLDARHPNALFNRALILERIGLTSVAAEAWRECVRQTRDAEAQRRHAAITTQTWTDARPRFEKSAIDGDVAGVAELVARFPQEVRTWGDVVYLTRWAHGYLQGDSDAAAANLQIARASGEALRTRGETLLGDAVAAIDARANDAPALRVLALAQQSYDAGRDAYKSLQYAHARKLFDAAAAGFERAGSPMVLVARSYTAFAIAEAKPGEGREVLRAIAARVEAHPGYRGQLASIRWVEGRSELFRGRWDDAAALLLDARARFEELGETSNAGAIDTTLADLYFRVGRADLAWKRYVAALRGTSAPGNEYRLQVAIAVGVQMAMTEHKWDVASSLLDIELQVAEDVRTPAMTSVAWRREFVVQNELGMAEARDTALARARIAASAADDEAQPQSAEIDRAEAVATMQKDPARAVRLLSRALEFAARSDRRVFVVELLHERGRAQLAAGDTDAAWADFSAGVEELERQRGATHTAELRAQFFDAAGSLFTDAVQLLVDRGDAEAAFRCADRARARLLLDAANTPAAAELPALSADTLLVEYALLERDVIAFIVRNGAVAMHRLPVTAAELEKKIDDLKMEQDALGDLHAALFAPLAKEIAGAHSLTVVPDGVLERVPFGALWDASAKKYVVQTHRVSIAPSAALLSRESRLPAYTSALLVANANGDEEAALPYLREVDNEIAAIRKAYRRARVLADDDATVARFTAEAAAYDVIHFGGHGQSDAESLTASLLFSSGRMYNSDIAKLRLPRAPLVVLGACGTLRGSTRGLEGMPSIARSFLAAGASTVIGTVLDVDDAASRQILTSFHRSIAAGVAPAAALQEAQRNAIASGGDDAHPARWAPYVVYTATR
jgi:CHAT domain-containing protein